MQRHVSLEIVRKFLRAFLDAVTGDDDQEAAKAKVSRNGVAKQRFPIRLAIVAPNSLVEIKPGVFGGLAGRLL